MQASRQFHVASKKRNIFDRKVTPYGSTRTVAMGKIIPPDWGYVRITLVKRDGNIITFTMTKLLGTEPLAPNPQANKGHRPDT